MIQKSITYHSFPFPFSLSLLPSFPSLSLSLLAADNSGEVAGAVVGVVLACALVAALVVTVLCAVQHKKRSKQ